MAHHKRVINFALFFMPVSNSPTVSWRFTPPGQFQTPQDKFGHPLPQSLVAIFRLDYYYTISNNQIIIVILDI